MTDTLEENAVDLSEFHAEKRRGGPVCWYRRLDLTPEQRKKIDDALATPNISAQQISAVLQKWHFTECGTGAVKNHRAKGCACE